jgi:hypothetical protein
MSFAAGDSNYESGRKRVAMLKRPNHGEEHAVRRTPPSNGKASRVFDWAPCERLSAIDFRLDRWQRTSHQWREFQCLSTLPALGPSQAIRTLRQRERKMVFVRILFAYSCVQRASKVVGTRRRNGKGGKNGREQ